MHKNEDAAFSFSKAFFSIITGVLMGLAVCIALLLAASAAVLGGAAPESSVFALTVTSCFLGASAAGFIAERKIRSRALLVGSFAGLAYFLFIILLGVLFFFRFSLSDGGIAIFLSSIGGGALGAILCANMKSKRRKK